MFDLSACHVERTEDQNYRVSWGLPRDGEQVTIYMSENPDHFYGHGDPGPAVLHTRDREVLIHNPDTTVRHYFYLESSRGEGVILAERQLPLEGTPNLRDLGGYEALDGRRLKWGKLYRSSKLSSLSDEDAGYVRRLGLTLICDFRQVLEQELEPTLIGGGDTHTLASLPVAPGSSQSFIDNLHNGILAVDDAAGLMEDMNRDFVVNQMPRYAEMFQLLLTGDQQVLIHCASGKDRTGVGAALILDVLGVEEDAIIEDYLLTNKYLSVEHEIERLSGEYTDRTGAPVSEEILRPLLEVRPEYLRACFDEIRKRYASRQHFYESALSLDETQVAKLKDRYLH